MTITRPPGQRACVDFRRGVLLNGHETQQGLVTAGLPWTPWAESQPTATIWTVLRGVLCQQVGRGGSPCDCTSASSPCPPEDSLERSGQEAGT